MIQVKTVLWRVVKKIGLSAFLWFLCLLFVSFAMELNREFFASTVWFPVVLVAFVAVIFLLSGVNHDGSSVQLEVPKLSTVIALGVALIVVSLSLTGWNHVLSGGAELRGDSLEDSAAFRGAYSLFYVLTAGVVEEFCFRKHCQLAISGNIGRTAAWLVASTVLILVHLYSGLSGREWLFVCLVSTSTGYLIYRGVTVRKVAALHAVVNAVPVAIVLLARA
jgi:hypothetical protein